jgi:protein-tyrosine phosphatase
MVMENQPGNFSFIDNFIAGSAFPYEKRNLDFFLKQGISNIVSITSDNLLSLEYSDKKQFNHLHLPLNGPPTNKQMITKYIEFLNQAKKNKGKVVIHCQFGQERTGILLAIYLVKFKGIGVSEAIKLVQDKRPHSLQMMSSLKYLRDNF